jgi:hypothetical protein
MSEVATETKSKKAKRSKIDTEIPTKPAEWGDVAEASARADTKVVRAVEPLPVQLTEAELAERGVRLASLTNQHSAVEAQKKEAMAGYKRRLDALAGEIEEVAGVLTSKTEDRDVDCETTHHYATGLVRTVRLDTGEVVSERAMNDAERQRALPFGHVTKSSVKALDCQVNFGPSWDSAPASDDGVESELGDYELEHLDEDEGT